MQLAMQCYWNCSADLQYCYRYSLYWQCLARTGYVFCRTLVWFCFFALQTFISYIVWPLYGRGEETIIDTSVGNMWQLAAHFTPQWNSGIKSLAAVVERELGCWLDKERTMLFFMCVCLHLSAPIKKKTSKLYFNFLTMYCNVILFRCFPKNNKISFARHALLKPLMQFHHPALSVVIHLHRKYDLQWRSEVSSTYTCMGDTIRPVYYRTLPSILVSNTEPFFVIFANR